MRSIEACVVDAIKQKQSLHLDNSAFSELVVRLQDMAFGYALSIVRDPYLARDAAQESFLQAWRRLETLREPAAFLSWFRAVVRHCSLAVRDDRRLPNGERFDEQTVVARGPGPERQAQSAETAREIRAAIDALPESLRASVVLHHIDGYSVADVATFLDISVAAAKKRLERGRSTMRKRLEDSIRDTVGSMRPSADGRMLDSVNLYTNFEIAARLGQFSLLEAMLVDGVDVNEPDATGRTLLHWAVEHGHLEAVSLLLRSGADQHRRDRSGASARHLAQETGNRSVLEALDAYR